MCIIVFQLCESDKPEAYTAILTRSLAFKTRTMVVVEVEVECANYQF